MGQGECVPPRPSHSPPAAASGAQSTDLRSMVWSPQTALPPLLEGLSVGDISVRSASVTGDASCVMVRGKLRPGFDVELELEWILPGEPPPAEAEPEPPPAEAEPEPPTETPAAEGSVEGDAGDADIDGDDDDDDDDDDDVPAEKDDGSTRGKITIAATDLDDEDDLVLSDIKVTKGDMEPYDAGKLLDGLREPVYEQLQAFKQAIVASCSG